MLVNDHLPITLIRALIYLFLLLPAPQFATATSGILTLLAPGEHKELLQESLGQEENLRRTSTLCGRAGDATWAAMLPAPCAFNLRGYFLNCRGVAQTYSKKCKTLLLLDAPCPNQCLFQQERYVVCFTRMDFGPNVRQGLFLQPHGISWQLTSWARCSPPQITAGRQCPYTHPKTWKFGSSSP